MISIVTWRGQTAQDLVVVALGVNDTLRLRSRRHWRERITRVLDVLQPQLAPAGQVLLAGVPDLGAFPALPVRCARCWPGMPGPSTASCDGSPPVGGACCTRPHRR